MTENVTVGREHDSVYVRLNLTGSDTPPTAARYISDTEAIEVAQQLGRLTGLYVYDEDGAANLAASYKSDGRRQAFNETRLVLSECVSDGTIKRDKANDILERLGLDRLDRKWTVRVLHNGDELLTLEHVEAATEEDAADQVRENLSVEVTVRVSCDLDDASDEYEWDDDDDMRYEVEGNLEVTATAEDD